jgi:hypothetical protein
MSQNGWPPWQVPVDPSGHGNAQTFAPLGHAQAQPVVNWPLVVPVSFPAEMLVELQAPTSPEQSTIAVAAERIRFMATPSLR